jgi:hypothetical protein
MQELNPEAAFFTVVDGVRTGFMFFDLKDARDLPRLPEPLFIGLNASIELTPAMNADDLKAGLGKVKL